MEPTLPQSNFPRVIQEELEDAVSFELMTKAVSIHPCGHVFNEDTIVQVLARNKLCPLDMQPIERYVPNYTVRNLAATADSPPLEEERKTSSNKEEYIDHLLRLLEEPAIVNNPSLHQLLGKEVEDDAAMVKRLAITAASLDTIAYNLERGTSVPQRTTTLPLLDLPATQETYAYFPSAVFPMQLDHQLIGLVIAARLGVDNVIYGAAGGDYRKPWL